jgi:hypothetical protein
MPPISSGGEDLAYALMVLAREGAAAIGDLRYYADVKAMPLPPRWRRRNWARRWPAMATSPGPMRCSPAQPPPCR